MQLLKMTQTQIVLFTVVLALMLLMSHWYFFATLHQGGIIRGFNAMFQIFGNLYALFAALLFIVGVLIRKISAVVGSVSALVLGFVALRCLKSTFAVMMSI